MKLPTLHYRWIGLVIVVCIFSACATVPAPSDKSPHLQFAVIIAQKDSLQPSLVLGQSEALWHSKDCLLLLDTPLSDQQRFKLESPERNPNNRPVYQITGTPILTPSGWRISGTAWLYYPTQVIHVGNVDAPQYLDLNMNNGPSDFAETLSASDPVHVVSLFPYDPKRNTYFLIRLVP